VQRWLRDRHHIVGPVLILFGIALVPWLLYLSIKLPNTARARNWALMWTGVDVAESIGLILTGVLYRRASPRRALPAAFTSALIAMDAWVDVTTSAPGHGRVLAIVLAVAVEVPVSVGCLLLALSSFPAGRERTADEATGDSATRDASGGG
jgi:hypothetical protein